MEAESGSQRVISHNHSFILILLVTVIFFAPILFRGETFYAFDSYFDYLPWSSDTPGRHAQNPLITDPVNAHYPLFKKIKQSLVERTSPLWNSRIFSGIPLDHGTLSKYINPTVFFPFLLFPLPLAHDIILWIHMIGAGIFMYLYLIRIHLNPLPSLIGAVAWMFNGYVMVWFEWEVVPILAFSLPAILFFFERWLSDRSALNLFLFGFFCGISVCSGYAHIFIYQSLFVTGYILYRFLSSPYLIREVRKKPGKKGMVQIALVILLLVSISADFVISHLSARGDSHRKKHTVEELHQKTGRLYPEYLVTLLFPDLYGSPIHRINLAPRALQPEPYNNYNELCIYTGVFTLFLAAGSMLYLLHVPHVTFYALTALITLTMAMGSLLYYPLAAFIPGLSLSTPTRILYLFGFSVSVLAAVGSNILLNRNTDKKWGTFSCWAGIFAVAVFIFYFIQTPDGLRWTTQWGDPINLRHRMIAVSNYYISASHVLWIPVLLSGASFLLLSLILFSKGRKTKRYCLMAGLILLIFDLLSFGRIYNTTSPRQSSMPYTDAIRFLKKDPSLFRIASAGHFFKNSFWIFGLSDIGGYASVYPKRYGEYLHMAQHGLDSPIPQQFSRWTRFTRVGSTLFDLINTKYVLLPNQATVNLNKLKLVYDREIKIYENQDVFPRFFLTPAYQLCKTPEEVKNALVSGSNETLRQTVILEDHPPVAFRNANPRREDVQSEITILSYTEGRIRLRISAERKGFLVMSENYHPDWKAAVDGQHTSILRANYIMQAIPIAEGRHEILLYYQPDKIIAGITITISGWMVLIGWIVGCLMVNRRRSIRCRDEI